MKSLKVVLIGAGQIARVSHIPAYRKIEGIEIVGICDTNIVAAEKIAKEFDIPYFTKSHIELLEACKPNAVSVCVPNKFHYPIVVDALNYGCHVMCEKPPSITYEEAKEMSDLAEKRNLILTYDFHLRHGKNIKIIKEKIKKKELGTIYFSRIKWLRRAGIPGWGSFINKDIQGGGPLIDIGAHMLDSALFLLDYPEISYVSASSSDRIGTTKNDGLMGSWDPQKYTVEDGLFASIHFVNGTCLFLETSFALNMKEKDVRAIDLFGDKAGVSLFPLEMYEDGDKAFANTEIPFLENENLHDIAVENFVKSCWKEEDILVTGKQGAYIQNVIEALYKSAETKMPVFQQK